MYHKFDTLLHLMIPGGKMTEDVKTYTGYKIDWSSKHKLGETFISLNNRFLFRPAPSSVEIL